MAFKSIRYLIFMSLLSFLPSQMVNAETTNEQSNLSTKLSTRFGAEPAIYSGYWQTYWLKANDRCTVEYSPSIEGAFLKVTQYSGKSTQVVAEASTLITSIENGDSFIGSNVFWRLPDTFDQHSLYRAGEKYVDIVENGEHPEVFGVGIADFLGFEGTGKNASLQYQNLIYCEPEYQ